MPSQDKRKKLVPYESEMIRTPSPLKSHLQGMFKQYKEYMMEQYRNALKADSVMLLEYPDQWLERLTTQWFEGYKRSGVKGAQSVVVQAELDPFEEFLNDPAHCHIPRDYLEYIYRRGVDNYDPDQMWCPLQRKFIAWGDKGYRLCNLCEVSIYQSPEQLDMEEFRRFRSRPNRLIRKTTVAQVAEPTYTEEEINRGSAQMIKTILADPESPLHEDAKSGALEAKYGISLADYPDVQPLILPTRPTHKPQGFSLLGADPQTLLRMLDTN